MGKKLNAKRILKEAGDVVKVRFKGFYEKGGSDGDYQVAKFEDLATGEPLEAGYSTGLRTAMESAEVNREGTEFEIHRLENVVNKAGQPLSQYNIFAI